MKNIYKYTLSIKGIQLIKLILGVGFLSFFAYLFKNEIYPDIWAIAGPLLGLAMVINGLTNSKIKEINVHSSTHMLEIVKESLFSIKTKKIKFQSLKSELKSANGKKQIMRSTKLKVVILENDKEIEELNSSSFFLNNKKLEKLHSDLKALYKDLS